MKRATGRPQSRRGSGLGVELVTVSFSLPAQIAQAVSDAAKRRPDMNKSAEVTEALAEWFDIQLKEGGLAKEETPA